MMKKSLSFNNNHASWNMTRSKYDNEQILEIIRSTIDELYETNNHENLLNSQSKEKRVRFTFKQETESIKNTFEEEKTPIKYQPTLSDSTTVVCCLIKGRSKVDCSVSTNDLPSLQCECATQTINNTTSLISFDDQLSICSKSTIITPLPSASYIIPNYSLYSYENTAQQLILPSEGKHYDICQEQILENYDIDLSNSSFKSDKNISEIDMKLCTCSKRKLSNNKLFEEFHLSKQSLQSLHNDGLFYIHDLIIIFLRNISEFNHILLKRYYLSKKQANLFVNIMNKWWKKK